jgi:hypothetical protein
VIDHGGSLATGYAVVKPARAGTHPSFEGWPANVAKSKNTTMRRAVPIAAIVLVLLTAACGTKASKNENAQDAANVSASVANLRASIPAIEAYWQDHNSYSGMTLSKLRQIDYGLPKIKIVSAKKRTYCVEIDVKGSSAFKNGPSSEIMLGSCSDPNNGKPYIPPPSEVSTSSSESLDAPSSMRAAIPAIEAYWQDHNGTYSGMTPSKLRQIDYEIPEIKIISAKKRTYCIEIDVKGSSAFTRGPMGRIESGTCPR